MGRKNAVQLKNEKVIVRIKLILLKGTKSDKRLDQQKREKMGASVGVLKNVLFSKRCHKNDKWIAFIAKYGPV